ncbi:STAS domain-containing protein [Amycolatopsis sp. lyj-23]|uniref:STAS domain-containing protein n=1 Tax=Amycolatopsis sp. lyj-23 TaxID=2789283 RepID=UPI00397C492D
MTDHSPPGHTTTTDDGIVIVSCPGELDLARAPGLRGALLGPIHAGVRGIVADLTETTYCDSTVFSVLVEAFRDAGARGVPYAIAAGESAVARPLQILGLDRLLPLHDRVEAAQAAVEGRPVAPNGRDEVPGASAVSS